MLTFLDVDFTPLKQFLACIPSRQQDSHRAVGGGRCDQQIVMANCVKRWLNPIAVSVVNCSRVEVVE